MVQLTDCNKLCVFFLSVLGLWPYGSKRLRLFKNIFIGVNVWLYILVQVLAFITMEMTLYRVLRNLTLMTISMGSFVKYYTIWYQANTVKGFIDRIQFDWQTNNDVILQIMQKHNYLGKQLSTFFTSCVFSTVVIMTTYHISPIILDKIAPLNESRPIQLPVDAETFFDKEKHAITTTITYYFWIAILAIIYIGTESLTIMICLHAASLFEVTSYYFQRAVSIEVTDTCIPRKCTNNKNMSHLIKSMIMHQETIQFCSVCSSHFKITYSPMIILGVTSLSINVFFLSQSAIHSANFGEAIFYLLLVIGVIQYMFLINLAIQYVMDSAANISTTMYMS
ncbi:uncharacterized protein LOC105663127 [Megachile rotundata]|uniref:uncharacterized protein LOC105663127 n=1 Tax=Megachile rotundata TaxID=143995 RepID=UPI003FD3A40D